MSEISSKGGLDRKSESENGGDFSSNKKITACNR